MAVINTNIASLNAQRNLAASSSGLATALQRLSSGLRINSAKDDAAGLAISTRMTSQINGLNQAARNANDGISLAQTAEGGMASSTAALQRIRELAVQSANSSNVSTDRASLNAEAQQLLQEIQRTATTTQFNGQNILDGSFTSAQFQVGANANQTINATINSAQTSALGSYQVTSGGTAVNGSALAAGDLTINGHDVGISNSGSAEDIAAAINNSTSFTGVTATASTTATSSASNPILRNQSLQSGDLVINGVNIGAVAGSNNIATQGKNIATAINAFSAATGVTATSNSATGALTLTSSTGKTISITSNNGDSGATRVENASGLELASAAKVKGVNSFAFANGVAQVNTFTSTSTAAATDTLTVGGVTFTYSTNANSATNIQIDNTSASAQAANVRAALGLAVTAGTLQNVTISGSAADTVITAKVNSKSTGSANGVAATVVGGTSTNGSVVATTAGVGLSAGDTVSVGGITYEFTLPTASGASNSGNVQVKLGATDAATANNFANAVSLQFAAGKGTAELTSNNGSGTVVLTNTLYGGTNVVAAPTEGTSNGDANALVVTNTTAGADGVYTASDNYGTIQLNSANTFTIGGNNAVKAGLNLAQVSLTAINTVDISTADGANAAIALIDGALSQINTNRANLGALQNRFENVVSNLSSTAENISAARSRILDADFAAETASLTRNQILQQAGTAMLAQANSLPNGVLALLRG